MWAHAYFPTCRTLLFADFVSLSPTAVYIHLVMTRSGMVFAALLHCIVLCSAACVDAQVHILYTAMGNHIRNRGFRIWLGVFVRTRPTLVASDNVRVRAKPAHEPTNAPAVNLGFVSDSRNSPHCLPKAGAIRPATVGCVSVWTIKKM